jgi:Arc/MetJ-type ribon-helix-helix transcriptional regulator
MRITFRYAYRMAQLVTRIDDELARLVDDLVSDGVVESRSDAVRRGLRVLVDDHRRRKIGEQIVRGYRAVPQTETEVGWVDSATVAMITEAPW